MAVLENFTNYWQKERMTRPQFNLDTNDKETEHRMKNVSSVISILDLTRKTWISLEDDDFITSTKVLLEIETCFHLLDKNSIPQPLIIHMTNSIVNVKHWLELSVRRRINDTKSDEKIIIAALTSICIMYRQTNLEETLDYFLQCSSFQQNVNDDLSSICVKFFEGISFVSKIIYQAFLNERSDSGVERIIRKNFPSYSVVNVERENVISKCKMWLEKRKMLLNDLLSPFFAKNLTLKEILAALSSLEIPFSNSSKSDWNHYTPLVFSLKLQVWQDFLCEKFKPALEEAIFRQVSKCPLKLDQSFKPVNVDMASFLWPVASHDTSDSLEMFELKIHGICPGYASASDGSIQYLKELTSQCEDLHPEVPIVDSDESKRIKELLVDSLVQHINESIEQMKMDVKHNELLTLQAINITRNLASRCKPLRTFFDLSCDNTKWLKVKSALLIANSEWIGLFIGNKIEIESSKCLKQVDLTGDWIDVQFTSWEEITITDASDSENKRLAKIKVPIYTSPLLLDYLYKIFNIINKYFGHVIPEDASVFICHKLITQLTDLYGKINLHLNESPISPSVKHKQALQFTFDIIMLKLIFSSLKDSQMKTILTQLSNVQRSFEKLIDPFDLHLISKNMQNNALKAVKFHIQLFSLVLPESSLTFLKKASTVTTTVASKS